MNPGLKTYLWTTGSALTATGGIAHGEWRADGVSIDSRTTKPGDLFVAIRGPRFDGHDFAADAFAAALRGTGIRWYASEEQDRVIEQ